MRLKALILEDDPIQGGVLARMLDNHGLYAEIAESGVDAIRRLQSGLFDVALIDFRVPDIDGVSVARIIRDGADPDTRPQLIALTAFAPDVEALVASAENCFDAVIAKPFQIWAVLATIHRCRNAAPVRISKAIDLVGAQTAKIDTSGMARAHLALVGPEPRKPRVLVVDDDPGMRFLLQMALQSDGYDTDTASDGLKALSCLRETHYDVAIIDYAMPQLNGLETAKLIYNLLSQANRPRLVSLTASADAMMQRDPSYAKVFDEVVNKIQGIPAVLFAVRRSLEYRKLRLEQPAMDVLKFQDIVNMGQKLASVA